MVMKIYQIDAFTNKLFSGNPAAVCILEAAEVLDRFFLNVAAENNLSETAFIQRVAKTAHSVDYEIRWFSPTTEVDLCGHATLAAAYAIFEYQDPDSIEITFHYGDNQIQAKRDDQAISLKFEKINVLEVDPSTIDLKFVKGVKGVYKGIDSILLVQDSRTIEGVNACEICHHDDTRGLVLISLENSLIQSRAFYPKLGIIEDPFTGSAQLQASVIANQLTGECQFEVKQLSMRGGQGYCKVDDEYVYLSGKCVTFLKGELL